MTDLGVCSFLPWFRRGSQRIRSADSIRRATRAVDQLDVPR
jgi:hypothetical protein